MKNVIITGATGMIGGIVVRHCLASDDVGKVTSLVRKSSGVNHPKLIELVCRDFSTYRGLEECFTGQDVAFFCLGAYTGQVPDAEFRRITVDYVQGFAALLQRNSPQATFCLLSGAGADRKEKSRVSFARYKGMAENDLLSRNFKELYLFRPGYIYPVKPRQEPNLSYRVYRWFYPLIRLLGKNTSITSAELGKAIFTAGMTGAPQQTLENRDILKFIEATERRGTWRNQ
jgi:uncharacterized protein YbjT (DUF2867 family)